MTSGREASEPKRHDYTVVVLRDAAAGEILTLQRAAYVSEAQAYQDFDLPPLTQDLEELYAELRDPNVSAFGVREAGRLIGAVRVQLVGSAVELGRLTVVPDRQGKGVGTSLLRQAEVAFPGAAEVRLFTGDRSTSNIRLYEREGYVETSRTLAGSYSLVHFAKTLTRKVL